METWTEYAADKGEGTRVVHGEICPTVRYVLVGNDRWCNTDGMRQSARLEFIGRAEELGGKLVWRTVTATDWNDSNQGFGTVERVGESSE